MIRQLGTRTIMLKLLGLMFCTVPVAACILLYFPVWVKNGSGEVLSGFTVFLLAMAIMPFYKSVKRFLASAAVYTLWLFAFILFFCLSRIAEEMTVISFVGLIGNLFGAICFKAARKGHPSIGEEAKADE